MSRSFIVLVALAFAACAQPAPAPAPAPEPAPAPVEAEPEPEPEPEPAPPPKEWDDALTDSVRVFSGLAVSEDSDLYAITQDARYQQFKTEMDAQWSKYEQADLEPIRAWAATELSELPAVPVFYPFSGPDILNAVSFLPQGTTFSMMGLESVAEIPRLDGLSVDEVLQSMGRTKAVLNNILGVNFFSTNAMAVNIGSHRHNGVAGVLSWFLSRTGHDVLEARMVALDSDGGVHGLDEAPAVEGTRVEGVEIHFRAVDKTSDEDVQTVWYFPGDISDAGWTQRPGLEPFVMAQGEVITFLKASSYLMFRYTFDDIRSVVLARSIAVIEGASGVPYHYFAQEEGEWDIGLYGLYTKPIDLFDVRCQPDLAAASAAQTRGDLPFHYDYTHWRSHMLVAQRAAGRALETPEYDASEAKGLATYCQGTKQVLEGH